MHGLEQSRLQAVFPGSTLDAVIRIGSEYVKGGGRTWGSSQRNIEEGWFAWDPGVNNAINKDHTVGIF